MNFFRSMMSESDGTASTKRWISVTTGAIILFVIVWIVVKYKDLSFSTLIASMFFVLILMGFATAPQIISLLRGTPLPDGSKIVETTDTKTEKTTTTPVKQPDGPVLEQAPN